MHEIALKCQKTGGKYDTANLFAYIQLSGWIGKILFQVLISKIITDEKSLKNRPRKGSRPKDKVLTLRQDIKET